MIFWGGAWVSSKIVTHNLHPQSASFWRFFLTLVAFFPFVFIFKQSLKINWVLFWRIFLSSLLMVIYFQLFFFGLSVGLAGIGGVIVTGLNPLFIFLIAIFIFKKTASTQEIFSLFLGLAGSLLILQVWNIHFKDLILSGNLFYCIAAVVWALVTLSSQYAQEKTTIWVYSFYLYLFSSMIQFFFAIPYDILSAFEQDDPFWLNMAYLALFPSIFSNTVYFYASSFWGSRKTGVYTFLVPFASVLLSWLFLNETPHLFTVIGGIIVTLSVYLIQSKKQKK